MEKVELDKIELAAAYLKSRESTASREAGVYVPMQQLTCDCGITFQVPENYFTSRERDNRKVSCPNGHRRVYWETPKPKADDAKLRELHRREQEEARESDREKHRPKK